MAPSTTTSSAAAAGDERILSYHDEVLYRSDLSILQSPTSFINDRLISFYFTHLSFSLSPPSSTLLIPPSLSFLLSLFPDPTLLSPLSLPSRSLILFPVNDNPDPAVPQGGTHWSLLVYHQGSNEFVHHDSLSPSNRWCAMRLYSAVKGFVGGDGEGGPRYVEGPTPRQRNGYDCGLFVMAVARVVCEWKEKGGGRWFGVLEEEVDGERAARLRGELLGLILRLMDDDAAK